MPHHSNFKTASKRNNTTKCLPINPLEAFPVPQTKAILLSLKLYSFQIDMTPHTSVNLTSSFISFSLRHLLVKIFWNGREQTF